jgi:hypothetical protein
MEATTVNEIKRLLPYMTEEEKKEVDKLIAGYVWLPLPGPQMQAYESPANILFYGGSAGGGKTDLLIGLALTQHRKSIIFRREGTQLQGIYDRMAEILGTREGFNSQSKVWRWGKRQIEFGHCKDYGSEKAYQGRDHSLKGFDEITHFLESQFRYLMTWNRSTHEDERCRIVCTGNPPTDSDGDWVREFWGPWLKTDHPNPAQPGELRWFTTLGGEDIECPGGEPIKEKGELLYPKSRTFIPSKVWDNPFLMSTDYEATLQALPEPLRSQMLHGDFQAGTDDDPWQVIPTDWVLQAQERWQQIQPKDRGPMDSIGVDPARGGRDETVIAKRYGNWFDELACYPGSQTPDGPAVAALVVQILRDRAPVHVDVIGIGSSVYDHLVGTALHTIPINSAERTKRTDRSKALRMANYRAALWWEMREALDPKNQEEIALPPGSEIRADLTAPRWTLRSNGVLVESKEDIKARIGRSPDKGDAIVYANERTRKRGKDSGVLPGSGTGTAFGM